MKKTARVCVENCGRPTKSPRSQRCADCAEKRRVQQLKANNVKWRKAKSKGLTSHRVMYGGKLTAFAKANPAKALAVAKDVSKNAVYEADRKRNLTAQKLLARKLG